MTDLQPEAKREREETTMPEKKMKYTHQNEILTVSLYIALYQVDPSIHTWIMPVIFEHKGDNLLLVKKLINEMECCDNDVRREGKMEIIENPDRPQHHNSMGWAWAGHRFVDEIMADDYEHFMMSIPVGAHIAFSDKIPKKPKTLNEIFAVLPNQENIKQ